MSSVIEVENGQAKKKKDRYREILQSQSTCIFCNSNAAETIDHIPSRQCFIGKHGPEGFEFPACQNCNSSTSNFEQVAAMYMRMRQDESKYNTPIEWEKMITGVANNFPSALPNPFLTANQKKQAGKNFTSMRSSFPSYAQAPMVEVTKDAANIIKMFNRKICCAIYYLHTGQIINQEQYIASLETPYGHKNSMALIELAKTNLMNIKYPQRSNTSINGQFIYKWNWIEKSKLFAYVAQFHSTFILSGFVSSKSSSKVKGWVKHRSDVESNWQWALSD